ncbi:MAG: peptidase U32 family protein [Candidatus Woesearchaeota archaeon]
MNKIELIVPAGNEECLKVAVENGADAVYFGINKFNARRRANNFTLNDVKKVVEYCHKNGVRAYCTLNILIKNHEIEEFFNTIKKLYLAGIDAIIIQQLSFLPIIKKNFPDLEVHISTQAAVNNSYFAELIKDADKVVLPREFSKKEIREFIEKTGLKTEIFVQGALCFSYSGKCLFSSAIGGRSGNRGLCAQPCRRMYNGKYLMSMKDLCLIEKIPEMIEIGVNALKIEGRLRSTKYVAAATKLYRSAIDSNYLGKFEINEELVKEMELSFNREFTKGYFNSDKDLVSSDKPMGRGLYLGVIEDGFIKLEEDLSVGEGVGIWFKKRVDGAVIRKIEKNDKNVDSAKEGEKVRIFVRADNGTKIYKTSSVKKPVQIKFIKNKEIKLATRKVDGVVLPEINVTKGNTELLVKVYSKNDAEFALNNGADLVFYNIFAEDYEAKFGAYIPRLLNDLEVEKAVKIVEDLKIKIVLTGNLGAYVKLKDKVKVYLDYDANLFNDYDLNYFGTGIISPELGIDDLKEFINKDFVVLVHGRLVLMNTLYPSLPAKITDEKGYVFPVRKEHNYYQILNSRELALFHEVLLLKKMGLKIFLDGVEMVKVYRDILDGKRVDISKKGYTKGHWENSVE